MNQDDRDLLDMTEPDWFRIEARHWSVGNEDGDHSYTSSELVALVCKVEKHTPKGAWLDLGMGGRKFVLREYQHRARAYAAPTLEQAKEDFRLRKQYRIDRLQAQINRAQLEIDMLVGNFR